MPMTIPLIPETAPFTPQQRAWLNGFLAAALSGNHATGMATGTSPIASQVAPQPAAVEDEAFPWHDPSLPIAERLKLAEGRPIERRLMAAMAQLDCGACGYLCKTYAEAIARGDDKDLTKCAPGGTETAKALKQILATASSTNRPANSRPTSSQSPVAGATVAKPAEPERTYTRRSPFPARLVSCQRLTHVDAAKDTRHVVIDLLDSGLTYEPGDSLGIVPLNCPDLVARVLQLLGKTGGERVGTDRSLRDTLSLDVTLTRCRQELFECLARHATTADKEGLTRVLAQDDNELLSADVAEVLAQFPSARPPVDELLASLAGLQPRLYSICSSQKSHPQHVHLTVGVVTFESLGRWRKGVASHFLGVRSEPGDEVRVFVQPSDNFRLPKEPSTPIIMIGPGTGVAPFLAFLEERETIDARGPSWLFFGNQHIQYDFLYRDQLAGFLDRGVLTRLDLAFSRDQAEKAYVQHKMLEHGQELWRWLEDGAHLYVCGDAKRMAPDVDRAIHSIVAERGAMSFEQAKVYVASLVRDRRYQRDVY